MADLLEERAKKPNAWNMLLCAICNKETWHYKPIGSAKPHCTQHSDWCRGLKHANPEKEVSIIAKMREVPENPSEWELRKANRMDQSLFRLADDRVTNPKYASMAGYDWVDELFDQAEEDNPRDPDKTYCTFCGTEVDYVNLTSEKRPRIRKRLRVVKNEDGDDITIDDEIEVKVETINACPNCCLKVRKPIAVQRV